MADRSSNGMQQDNSGDNQEDRQQSEKAQEYIRELMQEKLETDNSKCPNAARLLDQGMFTLFLSVSTIFHFQVLIKFYSIDFLLFFFTKRNNEQLLLFFFSCLLCCRRGILRLAPCILLLECA